MLHARYRHKQEYCWTRSQRSMTRSLWKMKFWIVRDTTSSTTSSQCLRKDILRGLSYLVGWLLGWKSTNEVQIQVFGRHHTDHIQVLEKMQRLLNTLLLFIYIIVKNSKFNQRAKRVAKKQKNKNNCRKIRRDLGDVR
jgi:hypothetical protein